VTEVDKSRSGLACGKTDGEPICVGDEVLVRGVVVRSIVGVGALVRFTSKNEDYQGWIREEDLRWSLSAGAELPPEPADDTSTWTGDTSSTGSTLSRRSGSTGPPRSSAARPGPGSAG
jgi:hypothetical protein